MTFGEDCVGSSSLVLPVCTRGVSQASKPCPPFSGMRRKRLFSRKVQKRIRGDKCFAIPIGQESTGTRFISLLTWEQNHLFPSSISRSFFFPLKGLSSRIPMPKLIQRPRRRNLIAERRSANQHIFGVHKRGGSLSLAHAMATGFRAKYVNQYKKSGITFCWLPNTFFQRSQVQERHITTQSEANKLESFLIAVI